MSMNPERDEMTKLADAAFEQAAHNAIERAKQTGTPLILWVDGAVKEVDPRDIPRIRKRRGRRS